MTPKQIDIIQSSWNFTLQNSKEAGEMFYTRLFELDPSLRALFHEDIKKQSQKLVSLISFVVHKLHTLQEILPEVRALGARHRDYRVKPDHYKTVAAALLWMLAKGLGDRWTEELEDAWVTAYAILSRVMITASEEATVVR